MNVFKCYVISKIYIRDDLFWICSLGFWGEVLLSIVLVFEMIVEIVIVEEEEGSYVILKGGKVEENWLVVFCKGIKMIVFNLFYNMFVCLKYVKMI